MVMLKDFDNGGCPETTGINGLSQQIIDGMNNAVPGVLVDFSNLNISINARQFTFLQRPAREALARAIAARGTRMNITSAYRTCAQQFLLRSRFEQRRCGIGAAALPGKSLHESGLALDIPDFNGWKPFMQAQGWVHVGQNLPGDPFHYEFRGGGTRMIGNVGILAFQKLWNQNHLNDRIGEDGIYAPGGETAARLRISPSQGFGLTAPGTNRILRLASPLMQGGDIRRVQMKLRQLNLLMNDTDVDGFYGPKTEAAIRRFQTDKGLTIDGIVGPDTYGALGIQ